MSSIQLHIKTITGETSIINCSPQITFYTLKRMIDKEQPYMIRLIDSDGNEFADESLISFHENIETIHCLRKLSRNHDSELLLCIKDRYNVIYSHNWDNKIPLSEWDFISVNDSKITDIK